VASRYVALKWNVDHLKREIIERTLVSRFAERRSKLVGVVNAEGRTEWGDVAGENSRQALSRVAVRARKPRQVERIAGAEGRIGVFGIRPISRSVKWRGAHPRMVDVDTALSSVLFGLLMGPDVQAKADDTARAMRGDRDAFSRLVAKHQRAVYGLAARLLGHGDDAKDAAQLAFVRAWERRTSFEAGRDFLAWVLGITRNAAIDRLRRFGRDDALAEVADPAPPVDEIIDARRGEIALEQAVQELPPLYREVIELTYAQGRGVADVAAIVDAPPGTIMTRLFRARRLLRARLLDS